MQPQPPSSKWAMVFIYVIGKLTDFSTLAPLHNLTDHVEINEITEIAIINYLIDNGGWNYLLLESLKI